MRTAKYAGYAAALVAVIVVSGLVATGDGALTSTADLIIPLGLFIGLLALAYGLSQSLKDAPWDIVAPRLVRGLAVAFLFYWLAVMLLAEPFIGILMALGSIGHALYRSYGQLRTLGHSGSAPLVGVLASTVIGAALWLVLRLVFGNYVWFSAVSILFALLYIVAVVTMVTSSHARAKAARAQRAAAHPEEAQPRSWAPFAVAIGAYLIYRLFLSQQIPYGPIIEWVAICIGVTIFAYAASKRIGIVPTAASLPPRPVRRHEQKVEAREDPELQRLESLVSSFVHRGIRKKSLAEEVEQALIERGHPADEAGRIAESIRRHRAERGAFLPFTGQAKALRQRNAQERSRLLAAITDMLRRPAPLRVRHGAAGG